MGWLVGYTLASIATSFIVVKIFDYIVGEAQNGFVSSTRAALFVLAWTAVTAKAGMHTFTKRVRQFRQGFMNRILSRVKESI